MLCLYACLLCYIFKLSKRIFGRVNDIDLNVMLEQELSYSQNAMERASAYLAVQTYEPDNNGNEAFFLHEWLFRESCSSYVRRPALGDQSLCTEKNWTLKFLYQSEFWPETFSASSWPLTLAPFFIITAGCCHIPLCILIYIKVLHHLIHYFLRDKIHQTYPPLWLHSWYILYSWLSCLYFFWWFLKCLNLSLMTFLHFHIFLYVPWTIYLKVVPKLECFS